MASSSSSYPNNTTTFSSPSSSVSTIFDPSLSANTTFVQADPSTFRAVVQRLTGASQDSSQKLPVTHPARLAPKPVSGDMGPRRSAFKLQERRQGARKLEIKLGNNGYGFPPSGSSGSPAARIRGFQGLAGEAVMVSPVSPLDLFGRGSPVTPRSPAEEEERAIAEKGFYLHPSPLSTPRGSEPELLPLFPLRSPRDDSPP
ncbi:hypothetical protein NMG60_11004871 [Bertholletia excelsa]